jgi:hypothetical protein
MLALNLHHIAQNLPLTTKHRVGGRTEAYFFA